MLQLAARLLIHLPQSPARLLVNLPQSSARLPIHLPQSPASLLIHLLQAPSHLLVLQISQDPARAALSSSTQVAIHVQVRGSLSSPVKNHKTTSNTIVSINTHEPLGTDHYFPGGSGSMKNVPFQTFFMLLAFCKYFFSHDTFLQTSLLAIFLNHVLTKKGGSLFAPI